ncbi:MAG TPA: TrmH family RNA methyltransferase [Gammaproteobacteria bacterium]
MSTRKPPRSKSESTPKPASVWEQRRAPPEKQTPKKTAPSPARATKPATEPAAEPAPTRARHWRDDTAARPPRAAVTDEDGREDTRRELKYYGIAACKALWEQRPHDIIRVYMEEPLIPKFTPLLRWAAAKRKAYHIVTAEDLERLTDSIHHQGICILARERSPLEFSDLLGLIREDQGRQLLVYLDGVENPHNLGAIVRSCAHFGVRFILGAEGRLPKMAGAACRVAEGGAEQVGLVLLRQPVRQLQQLQELGFQLVATAGARGGSLYQHNFTPRTLLILGAEGTGISGTIFEQAQRVLRIPGSGAVESLNVSVAFAVCAGEYARQQLSPRPAKAPVAAPAQSRKK